MSDPIDVAAKTPTARRILDAARALARHGGASAISMGEVAAGAGVSKALVHYHFRDKESLLLALVDDVGATVVWRARDASSRDTGAHALDEHWLWLARELDAGDVRILATLAEYDSPRVREASRRVARQRRDAAIAQTSAIFAQLGLTPRVPAALVADTLVAFTDGLAIAHALDPERDPRPAFDVLWLSLLALAE